MPTTNHPTECPLPAAPHKSRPPNLSLPKNDCRATPPISLHPDSPQNPSPMGSSIAARHKTTCPTKSCHPAATPIPPFHSHAEWVPLKSETLAARAPAPWALDIPTLD